ncbi:MAG: RDD family protein [Puniceicoccaceae bacterium]|nr:MAG: RDD family protein [Puniceicoccaceae bacterium]
MGLLMAFGLSSRFLLAWLLYHFIFWTWKATTFGGIALNLQIARLDGRKVDAATALIRLLGSLISFVALGLGFLWAGWTPERQSWHDKFANTVIVRLPKGTSLV